jgi:hypothetical protein
MPQVWKDPSINIMPADKGNVTVIMDTAQSNNKLSEVISSGICSKFNEDPTTITKEGIQHAEEIQGHHRQTKIKSHSK